MRRYFSLLLFTTLIVLIPFSQNKSADYLSLYREATRLYQSPNSSDRNDSIALARFEKVIELLQPTQDLPVLADASLKAGILAMTAGDNSKALDHFYRVYALKQAKPIVADSILFESYLYTGSIHYSLSAPDSAASYYARGEAILEKHGVLPEAERLYNKMGVLFYETGDYRKSQLYFEKALTMLHNDNTDLQVNYRNNIANCYLKLGEYEKALTIFKDLLRYKSNSDLLNINIAAVLLDAGRPAEALRFLDQVKASIPEKFNNCTKAHLALGNLSGATQANQAALKLVGSGQPARAAVTALTKKLEGDILVASKNYQGGLAAYQHAILTLTPGFTSEDITSNPAQFNEVPNFSVLFDALIAKARAWSMSARGNTDTMALRRSLDAFYAGLSLARHIERVYATDDARLFLKNKVNPACAGAVQTAIRLFDITRNSHWVDEAFTIAENNKASVLQAAVEQPDAGSMAGIPAELVAAERHYKLLLGRYNLQAARNADSATALALHEKIREAELQLSVVQRKLDENPAYHALRFQSKELGMEKIRALLPDKGAALISYYYSGDRLHCFYLSAEASGVVSTPVDTGFFEKIARLRKELAASDAADRNTLNTLCAALYKILLQPVEGKLTGKTKLIIIPYNELNYIPFEILQDAAGSALLTRFAIVYNYAAGFLRSGTQHQGISYRVLGMAPFAQAEDSMVLPVLASSGNELKNLEGQQYQGPAASRQQFILEANKFPVIHLATHALADDQDPAGSYIAFFGKTNAPDSAYRLYEKEIYNLPLKDAQLVILSACETGAGKLVNGEGVFSLSRAFSYAGCQSAITSLWKADDQATTYIMQHLHQYLQKGYTKDEALQHAKLDYLNDAGIPARYKTPAYWAHLVLIGSADAVVAKPFPYWTLVLAAALLLLIPWWLLRKRQ